ncbi:MAG TPA: efflux RND transporter periplasmic adaptor subunit [Bacillota bacterium]|nr:HlyD family secretion protein [Peptococcaceae bacterium]HPZ43173.1 efflux RND transporter periplasmic adaptor subunit [Bacillota bacterium]HQD75726.1 efflux RND transporter periplasmic adaptor subunit [Bacillota bacterium]HUM58583.1 efflux RND transporter periplasmic adaptor subunit [Bacillota bacterium]
MRNKAVIYMVVAAMMLSLGGVSFYYWYKNTHFVDTEDARVDGIIVKVSPQISGIITEMYVEEGDLLQKGALIARQVDYTLSPDANLDLSLIKSPISGTVIKKIGNVGEVGVPGSPVAMLADLNNLYITANIEETELARVKPGQVVEFTIDSTPGIKYSGRVLSIGEATVSTFSLLPSQNTSGSFTKVVQRIPVKIGIDGYQGQRLLPGMNAVVRIYVK